MQSPPLKDDIPPAHDSLEAFERELVQQLPAGQAHRHLNRVYRKLIPRWHFAMLNDGDRNQAFRSALEAQVRPGDSVLDVGTGSGLLAMMAIRAGARHVTSCEMVQPIAYLARQIVAANGLAERISIVPKASSDLKLGPDLPSPADVLVTETLDCGLLGEGIIPIVQHARTRLLKEDARIIPARARLLFSLLDSSDIHRTNCTFEASGFDVSSFNRFSTQEYFPVRLQTWRHTFLSHADTVFEFDFQSDALEPRSVERPVRIQKSGSIHGVLFWFELDLGAGIRLSNAPDNPRSHWMQAFQCFEHPVRVEAGHTVTVQASHDATSVHFSLAP
ncbi:50S ribosomal protein L11 methyltransferase [Pyxidicoccus sp. MSG2]|uniref:50S ribosomal protein L11 methyltransferase n=1 Tax=Pyxidicoccus sp. MSG2 TaxID=2996790 RepID=UPI00226D7906|nr:50S ribosomal protein L11 methyltransferase [Pyxidicoccus sp. MSG2]MCY1018668.1 50S ribosomal protein L11 methyltransferase [Pyxidicoccus sp. MSG2]